MTTLFHHSARAFLRLAGPDAPRYLNGQITQNVLGLKRGEALWTAITNAKGRIEGVGQLRRVGEQEYLIDCPRELGDLLEARLERYLIADDCYWSREDSHWALYTCLEVDELTLPAKCTTAAAGLYRSNRLRQPSLELLYQTPSVPDFIDDSTITVYSDNSPSYEGLRIAQKVPAWGKEIQPGALPAECGLEQLALCFEKGCYTGQEIISRLKASGKKRTQLYLLTPAAPLSEGTPLFNDQEKQIGTVTSVTISSGKNLALALCKEPPQHQLSEE